MKFMMKKNKPPLKTTIRNRLILTTTIAFVVITVLMLHNVSYASWVEEEDGIRYLQEDGQYAVGFLDIEGKRYYFDSDGHLVFGKFYVEEENSYYYSDEMGVLQYGAIQAEEDFYITDEEGRLATGFAEYEGSRYFFNELAQLVVGWFKNENSWYYADGNGRILTGFITVDGYRYYLGDDGSRVSDAVLSIDGITYIFNKDGSVDENATALYPVFQHLNQIRVSKGFPELVQNSKVQSCAILCASELVDSFDTGANSIEQLLANRGVQCVGGFEFAYGGLENYDIDCLIRDMTKDVNLMQVLADGNVSEVGLGVFVKDGVSYYDIIFISLSEKK